MNFTEWEKSIPETLRADSLWKMAAYRLALFACDVGWHDVTKLAQDRRTLGLSGQLYEALGSIGANIAEGYSRGTGRDRARFYEYALGSARESRDWYIKGRHLLGETVINHRLALLSEVIRLLLTMIPEQRGRVLREEAGTYSFTETNSPELLTADIEPPKSLLEEVPMPA